MAIRLDDPDLDTISEAPDLAAASHRGHTHQVDEDAYAIARREVGGRPLHVLVVCDGVSTSSHGEEAAALAARAALDAVLLALDAGDPLDGPAVLRRAVGAAHRATCAADIDRVPGKVAPGTTLIAALAHDGTVDVAWVGDSRAYLARPAADGDGAPSGVLLTHDHSWLNELVAAGELTAAEAASSPGANALTHCIGPLENPDPDAPPEPSTATVPGVAGTRLVVCSDGLWGGANGPEEIAALAFELDDGADAQAAALHLVRCGLAMAGHDDVTVAVAFL